MRSEENRPGRREFLSGVSAALVAAKLGGLEGWLFDRFAKLGKIGIQLYTVRDELAKNAEATLARLAGIGFKEVEFAGYPEGTAQSLRKMLGRHGLQAPSSPDG